MSLKYNIERKTIPHKFEERTCWRKSGLNDIDTYKLNLDYILPTLNVMIIYVQTLNIMMIYNIFIIT